MFNIDDVIKVARAVEDNWCEHEDGYASLSRCPTTGYICRHCDAHQYFENGGVKYTEEDVKHKLDCVVLVARDLLTGAKGN
jgi:hypothetical protein